MSSDAVAMGAATTTTPADAAPVAAKAPRVSVRDWSTARLTRTLRLVNLCNGISMIAVGILVFFVGLTSVSFTSVTVSAYIVFFGLLLSCLECNISALAPRFHRNFGFMYSFIGRAAFLFFAGTVVMALANWLTWVVGSLTVLNGFFNGYVICVHPSFKSGELSAAADPYGGYSGGEAEMLSYLKKNPQLAQQAGASAAAFAQSNPQVAAQVLTAATAAPGAPGAGKEANPWGK